MKVRLLKPWKYQKVGKILNEMPDGAANMLIKRGFAEQVKPEVKKQEKPLRVRD